MAMIPIRGPNWHPPEWYRQEAERKCCQWREEETRESFDEALDALNEAEKNGVDVSDLRRGYDLEE